MKTKNFYLLSAFYSKLGTLYILFIWLLYTLYVSALMYISLRKLSKSPDSDLETEFLLHASLTVGTFSVVFLQNYIYFFKIIMFAEASAVSAPYQYPNIFF